MVRHEQSSDDFAVQHVPLHDLGDIVLCTDPVPHAFRIDDDTWAEVTMIEATGFVCSDTPFEIYPLCFALEVCMKFFRTQVRATAAWIVFGTLIRTDEDMSLK